MTLISLPYDIYPNVFSNLTRSQIYAFGRVATFAQAILLQLAGYQQENVNRNGEKDTILPGTIARLFQQLFKMEIVNANPEIVNYLKQVANLPQERKQELEFSFDSLPVHVNQNTSLALVPKNLKPLFVVFDFDDKKMSANSLQTAAFHAITGKKSPAVLRGILLAHPNAKDISAKGDGGSFYSCEQVILNGHDKPYHELRSMVSENPGLGFLLECALNTYDRSDEEKLELLKIIAAHPAAKDIPLCHLYSVLSYAVCGGCCVHEKWKGGSPAIVRAILTLPNASKIQLLDEDRTKSLLKKAKTIDDPEMIELLTDLFPSVEEDAKHVVSPKPKRKHRNKCSIQ